jgi:hypothetical protein
LSKKKSVKLEEILKQPGARRAWASLKDVPEPDQEAVKRHLEAIANQKPSFRWHPPTPRDARRLAAQLLKVAPRIVSMNIYFSSRLPLGNSEFRKLPQIIEEYAEALKKAAGSRRKVHPSSCENWDREFEIVGLLEQADPARHHHDHQDAVTLIQAAYNAGYDAGLIEEKIVDSDSLRRAYERRSYRYRRSSLTNHPR